MTARTPNGPGRGAKRTISISVILGTLLVPVSAVAALMLSGPSQSDDQSAAAPTTTTLQSTGPTATGARVAFAREDASPDDLAKACGSEGMDLISLESEGTISEVQQAALDALRDICHQEGIPLPTKAQPEPMTQTVVVTTGSNSSPVTRSEDDSYYEDEDEDEDDEYYDDEYYDDDDYEDEDHDDHEKNEHEDEDHEDEDHEDEHEEDDD